MKLEIELDLNQIDYDAINKQIQEKIADMDLEKSYSINSRIGSKIQEEVDREVGYYLRCNSWGGNLNDNVQRDINDEIQRHIEKLVKTNVEKVLNQIPTEELNKLISDLIPKVLMDLLISNVGSSFYNYCEESRYTTLHICEEKIQNLLRM